MSTIDEERILIMAQLSADGLAMDRAMLEGDFDEARFRAEIITLTAAVNGFHGIEDRARRVLELLGPSGSEPAPGYGDATLQLANVIAGSH